MALANGCHAFMCDEYNFCSAYTKNESLSDNNSLSRKNQKFSLVMCRRVSDAQYKFAANRFIILKSARSKFRTS